MTKEQAQVAPDVSDKAVIGVQEVLPLNHMGCGGEVDDQSERELGFNAKVLRALTS